MKATFNVLNDAWIPVVTEDGSMKLLGIRDTLVNAHRLREISDPSPLDEYSVYRFLCLFLMDAIRPKNKSEIRSLLKAGRFDPERIERYIKLCLAEGVSFDLFDPERPFLQSAPDASMDGNEKPVAVLDCMLPSGNNHAHFIHCAADRLTPDVAMKKILTTYWFCTAGTQGPSGVYGAPPYFGVIRENRLFEMLVDLLIPIDSIGIPFDDPPVLWRMEPPIVQKAMVGATSWLHGMLFPSRRIRLNSDENGSVCSVWLSPGENYVNKENWRDPHVTYRKTKTSVFPLRPHAENAIWRNVADVIDVSGAHAAEILCLYRTLHGDDVKVCYSLYGVETSQASYLSVQKHDLTLPMRLADGECIDLLHMCVAASDRISSALRRSFAKVASIPLSSVTEAEEKHEKLCEDGFWRVCRAAEAENADFSALYASYLSDVFTAAEHVFEETLTSLRLRARALSEAEKNRRSIYMEYKKLKQEAGL